MASHRLALAVCGLQVFLLLAMASCDIFSPRDAEEPAGTAEWNAFPVSPHLALQNLRYAWLYSQNASRYGELLTDDFVFYCDQQDVVEYGVAAQWDAGAEANILWQVYSQIASAESVVEFTEVEGEEDVIETDAATMVRDYRLELYFGAAETPVMVTGRLAADLARGQDGLWRLQTWQDSRIDNETTSWGRMKDAYRS